MPEQTRFYTVPLTDTDYIKVSHVRSRNRVLKFSVQYNGLIEGRWRKVTRYDNAHGSPHRHVYYPDRAEYKHPMSTIDNNLAFTEAQTVIKKNFMHMRERYIM